MALSTRARAALTVDAKNRALRTLLVNLATDVGVAVVLVIYNGVQTAQGWSDIDFSILGFSLLKTAIVTAGSFILRRFLDPSTLPTPLPPAPQPVPNDPDLVAPFDGNLMPKPGPFDQGYGVIELVVLVAVVVLAIIGIWYLAH